MTYSARRPRRRVSFRRRSSGAKQVTEPRRYQSANFFQSFILAPDAPNTPETRITQLADMASIIWGTGANQNRAIQSAVRGIELGGIVLRASVGPRFFDTGAPNTELSYWYCWLDLYWDRVDANQVPSYTPTINPNSQFPIAAAPLVGDQQFPVRYINRQFIRTFANYADNSEFANGSYPINKRLRRRIGDREGLYFAVTAQTTGNAGSGATAGTLDCAFAGTLYYRLLY